MNVLGQPVVICTCHMCSLSALRYMFVCAASDEEHTRDFLFITNHSHLLICLISVLLPDIQRPSETLTKQANECVRMCVCVCVYLSMFVTSLC